MRIQQALVRYILSFHLLRIICLRQRSTIVRYDETDLILREYYESGTGSDRSATAMARMNAIHEVYGKEISNADMLFTLSLFVTSPAVWIDRRGLGCCL